MLSNDSGVCIKGVYFVIIIKIKNEQMFINRKYQFVQICKL
jgi:hypothetical protein